MKKSIYNRYLAIAHDLVMIPVAWVGAYWLRYNLEPIPAQQMLLMLQSLLVVMVIQSVAFRYYGLYRGVWRFASIPDLIRISKAVLVGTAFSIVALFLIMRMASIPRSVFPIYGLLLVALLGGTRLLVRWSKDRAMYTGQRMRVLVVGAGKAGEMLVRDLLRSKDEPYEPIGFIDDSPAKQGREIHGVRVLGPSDELIGFAEHLNVDLLVLAVPSAKAKDMRRLVGLCEKTGLPLRTLPPIDRLMTGEVTVNQLREVSIDDLLGREPVSLDWESIGLELSGKRVLVTGAGGSIGSELCRQILRMQPSQLVLLDSSEFNLYSVETEFQKRYSGSNIVRCLVNVADKTGLEQVFRRFEPQVVFHAAAYKHVPMLEDQIREAALNNVLGTKHVADLADENKCDAFVMISTDKAVNPANVMGASKRAAEIYCQNLNQRSDTRFVTVRFGNVLGSAGSVVPLFQKQIESGGPVTVTHREITRYFMTIPEACQLILQASAMGKGGEIFVLDMGEPIKIAYLAEQMIRLSGKVPDEDIAITYTGLRPGEKLYEELFHESEALHSTTHEKILLARYRTVDWDWLGVTMGKLESACGEYDEESLKGLLLELVPEWQGEEMAARESEAMAIPAENKETGGGIQPTLH